MSQSELDLSPQTHALFQQLDLTPSDQQDEQQLLKILKFLLGYPSNSLAQIHRKSNRLGKYDELASRQLLKKQYFQKVENYATCECCYTIVQQTTLKQTTRIEDIVTLGEATKLFFNDIRFAGIMMTISLFLYGIYSFATNISASNRNSISCFENKTCKLALISLGSKIYTEQSSLNRKFYIAQVYIGLVMIIIWAILFILKTFQERKITMMMDNQAATASDFSVMFINLPKTQIKQTLQAKLDEYADNMKDLLLRPESGEQYDGKFTISKFNPVRAYYETLKMSQKVKTTAQRRLADSMEKLRNIIRQRKGQRAFTCSKQQREQLYRQIDQLRVEVTGERVRQLKIIEQTYRRMELDDKRIVFVTFNHTYSKINLLRLNEFSLIKKLKMWIWRKSSTLSINIEGLQILNAPQPEDVMWMNVGVSNKEIFIRRFFTFFITILVLGGSFAAIYGLSTAQEGNINVALSFLLSLVINVVNIVLNCFIQLLTVQEKYYTTTQFQISVGLKVMIAQLVNSIVLSMLAAIYIKNNIYQEGGLVDDVFYFALLNCLFPPIIRMINPYYFFLLLRKKYYSRPNKKLYCQSQIEFNQKWEAAEFEIGLQYVYILKTVIYTAFFMALQPIIILFAILGIIFIYQAQKFSLFFQSIRPKPSSNIITLSMNSLFYFSIIAYGLGSLTWTNFLPKQGGPRYTLAPNIISIIIGVFVYFVTFGDLTDITSKQKYASLLYQKQRLFLPSQYDRLNPISKSEGLKSFIKYLEKKKQQHKQLDEDKQGNLSLNYISKLLLKSKYQSKVNNMPLSNAVISQVAHSEQQKVDPLPPKMSKVVSLFSKRRQNEVQAAISRIQSLRVNEPLDSEQRINFHQDQNVHVNTQQLKDIIAINALQQKPSMISNNFNPIDFIEAVNDGSKVGKGDQSHM